jgi:hypothetical protein
MYNEPLKMLCLLLLFLFSWQMVSGLARAWCSDDLTRRTPEERFIDCTIALFGRIVKMNQSLNSETRLREVISKGVGKLFDSKTDGKIRL